MEIFILVAFLSFIFFKFMNSISDTLTEIHNELKKIRKKE